MTTETDPDLIRDDNESIGLFEPLVVSQGARSRARLNDLARTLAEKSTALCSSLPAPLIDAIAELITAVNCFYRNLIEGHEIDLVDLQSAVEGDLSKEQGRRVLQLEALAHMSTQNWLDASSVAPFSVPAILEIHRRFYELLPPELLSVRSVDGTEQAKVEPGILRSVDVKIGRHLAISPGAIPRFLARMEQGYRSAHRGERIVMAACGHHRLLWVHPFADGNGRVARLVLHHGFERAIDARSLWSASRGLALREKEYRAHLEACDEPRRGSLDGRGSLSEGALASFAAFILECCIDQIDFMSKLLHPLQLTRRVLTWVDEMISAGVLKQGSQRVLKEMLHRGQLTRADIAQISGGEEGHAKVLIDALAATGIVRPGPTDDRLTIAFPIDLSLQLFPGLFHKARG
jgi:Fic family protein